MAATRLKSEARGIAELLGVDDVIGRKAWHVKDMQDLLRKGFPYKAFEKIVHVIEVRPGELATIVGVAPRTLARRKSKRQLSPIESDRLYRVARITFKASETLGSLDKARVWLQAANTALGGQTPISRLDTEIGEREVEDLLDRINFGILS